MTYKIQKGSTVLITGGTQGIGLEFAKICAQDGHNLIIVGRSLEKTSAVAKQLMDTFPVTVTPFNQDLSQTDGPQELYDAIAAANLTVDVLINNAGFGIVGDFAATQLDYEVGMMRLNMESVVKLTKLFLPHMIGKKKGHILNVSSFLGFQGSPHMAVYAATKAFVLSFSEALSEELASKHIYVTALCPSATKTGFQENAKMGELKNVKGTPSDPYVVALQGYKGLNSGKHVVVPGLKNRMFLLMSRFLSRSFFVKQLGRAIRGMSSTSL